MAITMKQKYIIIVYYYLRYSIRIWLIGLFYGILALFGYRFPSLIEIIYFTIMFCCFPAFWILPGIIYENSRSPLDIRYNFFFGLTVSIGPALIYLCKYEDIFKKIVYEEKN